ncbi:MAG: IS1380 family transposase [Anaerolineales bacterium]
MRLRISQVRQIFKKDLPVEFTEQNLSSFGGLELFCRYFKLIQLHRRVRDACRAAEVKSDYGCVSLLLVVVGMLLVGARRLEQLKYLRDDPLVLRLCGLKRMPTRPTVVNWLKQFTVKRLQALIQVNSELLYEQIERLELGRLTIDLDGSVIQAGNQVRWTFRGFNPHRKKNKSYYPLLAHLAQTGQILKLRNRPGNVHDSTGADRFLRELIEELRCRFGRRLTLEFRMDAAFFKEKILKRLQRQGCEFAIKAPFWPWLELKAAVASRKRWSRVSEGIDAFEIQHHIRPWDIRLRIVIYRKRVRHKTPKNFQLDLFSPDDGYFEYSAIATNKSLTPKNLWEFAAGRGAQEKTLAELRGQFGLDVVPTNDYAANNAWQQLNILAHNLCRGFQLDTIATTKPRSPKRTYAHLLHSVRTLRFLIIAKAGRLVRCGGRNVLRMSSSTATQRLFENIELALAS